jgi:membrane dipeptidase
MTATPVHPAEVAAVHREAPVLLAHVHMQRRYLPDTLEYVSPEDDVPGRQVDIPKLRRGGVKYIWLSEGAPGEFAIDPELAHRAKTMPNYRPANRTVYRGGSEVQRLIRGWDVVRRLCDAHAEHLALAQSVGEARSIVAAGKIAVFWHTETLLLANDLAALRAYHQLGMRVTGLVHAAPLDWIDSDKEQRHPGGLTDFGRRVIREMNALGIVIDVSHASDQAIADIAQESRQPIVASHSNVRQLAPVNRNLSDESIRAIAAGGGVIGIHCSSALIDAACLEGRRGLTRPKVDRFRYDMIGKVELGAVEPFGFEADYKGNEAWSPDVHFPTTTLDRLIDHIDELVKLAGIDHIGVGTDFQYLEDVVHGYSGAHETPNLTAALLARGYSAEATTKILGGNMLRVMEETIGH